MLKRYHQTVGITFRAVDACVIAGVWILSYWGRFYLPVIEVTKGFPAFAKYAALTPLIVILWQIVFSSAKLYQSQRMLRRTHEAFLVLRAHSFAMLLFISLTFLFAEYQYSRGVMLYFGCLGAVALLTLRLGVRNFLRSIRRKGYNLRHALIVGEGPAVETLIWKLKKFPEIGIAVLGVVAPPESNATEVQGAPVLGRFADLPRILGTKKPDQILIALPRRHADDLDSILNQLKDETVEIQLVPDIQDYVTLGCAVEDFDGMPIVKLNDSPLDGIGAALKRITDFVLGTLGLLFLFPVLAFVAILVKLTSRGPIFYAQERCGLDGRSFRMWKFRSMRVDAEEKTGAVWAKKDDDRRTPIGTFLRATSIDELPQLWNVVRGEMSLVGPRPERPVFVDKFRGEVPHYMLRHKVKAGITGWAQVNGWRGDTSLEQRIECDLYYIRNWSYTLDLKILWMTVWKGFVNKNAY
ncbi:MAG: undecaprenyl-phosphate glucose phosphotransferase [Bdellovibrionales bacterium]|nr:undecaprenyl-phosphate glucose phosphotransferase [Bdellovibrionales bacterium]